MLARTVVVLGLLLGAAPAVAQEPDPCALRLGTNLASPSDYGAEWAFVDIMRNARTWISHNSGWVDGGENAWDTGLLAHAEFDADGYPLEVPFTAAGAETTQVVRTVWANTGTLPAGTYTVLYDGEGRLDVWGDATPATREPGRLTFDLDPRPDGLFALEIERSVRGDHVRNIRVLLPGHEATYATDPWTPSWLDALEPFEVLRFMDWGRTNNSPLQSWDERPRRTDYTWTATGVPYELWTEICNRLDTDAWVCVPHRADDEYIRNMATLFRDRLEPERTIYLEYSNELWNWMFDQTHWCHDQGDPQVPWPERIAPFVQNVFDIWTEVFTGQEHRLVRVVGVQGSYQDVSNRIVESLRPGSFDAFAPAAYFGLGEEAIADLEAKGAAATADDVLYWARRSIEGRSFEWLRTQKTSIGDTHGIPMLTYEGGQHLTPEPFGSDQSYGPALVAANQDPRMYDLYAAWLDSLSTLNERGDPGLFMNFSFIAPPSARYGSWGALERQFDADHSREASPKYAALVDHACGTVSVTDPGAPPDGARPGLSLHPITPNPFNPRTTIGFELPRRAAVSLRIYDVRGRIVDRLIEGTMPAGEHTWTWSPGESVPSGLYFVRLDADGRLRVRKATLLR